MKKKLNAAEYFLANSTGMVDKNIFIGPNAGYSTTTGNMNTAIGGQVLQASPKKTSSEKVKEILKYSRISKEFEDIIDRTKDSFNSITNGKRK